MDGAIDDSIVQQTTGSADTPEKVWKVRVAGARTFSVTNGVDGEQENGTNKTEVKLNKAEVELSAVEDKTGEKENKTDVTTEHAICRGTQDGRGLADGSID